MNTRLSLGTQRRNRESHRDPVIACGIDFRTMQLLPAGYGQAIVVFIHLRPHGTQIATASASMLAPAAWLRW